jgi:hypothetical protein
MTNLDASKAQELLGFLGSLLLAIPSVRQAMAQWRYKRFLDIPAHRAETKGFDRATEEIMERKAKNLYSWNVWNVSSVFTGSILLASSFAVALLT